MYKTIAIIAATLYSAEAVMIQKPAASGMTAKDIVCRFAATKRSVDGWYSYMDTEHVNRLSLNDFQTALAVQLHEAKTDWTAEWADQMR